MLALIPFIDLVAIYVALRCVHRDRDWRESVLAAAVIWGTLVALSTELLGLLHAIQRQTSWIILGDCFGLSLYVIYRQTKENFFQGWIAPG